MQYKIVKAAKADAESPKLGTECDCHYRGTLLNGFEFDSSKRRGKPATFAPKNVIRGWTIAMQLMGVGDKWMLWIPSEFAYGDAGRADATRGQYIPPGAVLCFELDLLQVTAPNKTRPKRPASMPDCPPDVASAIAAAAGSAAEAEAPVDVSETEPAHEPPLPAAPPTAAPPPTTAAPPPEKASSGAAGPDGFDAGVDATLEAVSTLLNRLELPTLQQALVDLGLPTDGEKRQLSERITNALQP